MGCLGETQLRHVTSCTIQWKWWLWDTCYEKFEMPEKVVTVFVISLYIHDTRSLACDLWRGYFRFLVLQHFSKAKKNIYVYLLSHVKKNLESVGRDYFFLLLSAKPEIVVPGSGISFSKFSVKWRIMQFFYLLCSQFRQIASSWINKTLLLVKQQKWLSKFCTKIRVGRVTANTHIFFWAWRGASVGSDFNQIEVCIDKID